MTVATMVDFLPATTAETERFFDKVEALPNGCIVWKRCLSVHSKGGSAGYGKFSWRGVIYYAHRWIFEQYHGRKIKPGYQIDHRCETRACINPYHLEEVTGAENTARIHQPWRRTLVATAVETMITVGEAA